MSSFLQDLRYALRGVACSRSRLRSAAGRSASAWRWVRTRLRCAGSSSPTSVISSSSASRSACRALTRARAVESILFGVNASDPSVFALGVGRMIVVGHAAAWPPARRAARTDALDALRSE